MLRVWLCGLGESLSKTACVGVTQGHTHKLPSFTQSLHKQPHRPHTQLTQPETTPTQKVFLLIVCGLLEIARN